jgi:hypothetical protein
MLPSGGSVARLPSRTNLLPNTQTRAEITTLSGTFVAQQRIRVTSGARINSLTYSTGLHTGAQNTWVGVWLNYATASTLPPAVGDNVVVDTLNTTIALLSVDNFGTGNAHLKDFICTNSIELNDRSNAAGSTTGGSGFIDGCQLSGTYLFSNQGAYCWSCRITTAARVRSGNWKIDGCSVQGNLYCFPSCSVSLDDFGNTFDGGTFIVGGTSASNRVGPASARVAGFVEFCNGIAASAISVSSGAVLQTGQTMWSGTIAGAAYTRGIQVDVGGSFYSSVGFGAGLTINATTQLTVAEEAFTFAQAPIANWELNCFVLLVPGNVQNARVFKTAQSTNIALTNLFSSTPMGGLSLLLMSLACTTADAAETGAPVLTVNWTDDSGQLQTETITCPLTVAGSARKVVAMQISHGNNTNPQYSVTGITSIGNARFSLEIESRRMVYAS